jgi:hypothetical protein
MPYVVLALVAAVLWSCLREEKLSYSDFTQSYLDKASYNVWFGYPAAYRPNGIEGEFIGRATGLSECGQIARAKAAAMQPARRDRDLSDWSYVCCLRAKESECYEKHR